MQWTRPITVFQIPVTREGITVQDVKTLSLRRLGIYAELDEELQVRRIAKPSYEVNGIFPALEMKIVILAGSRVGLSWRRLDNSLMMMIDSGSQSTAGRPEFAPQHDVDDTVKARLKDIQGNPIEAYGKKMVDVELVSETGEGTIPAR